MPERILELTAQASNVYLGYQAIRSGICRTRPRKLAAGLASALLGFWLLAAFHSTIPIVGWRVAHPPQTDWLLGMGIVYGIYATCVAILLAVSSRLPFRPSRRLLFAGSVPAAITGYGVFIERQQIRLVETTLTLDRLPKSLQGLRIVQISDIHYGSFFGPRMLDRTVAIANECRAHIALFTGDLITNPEDPLDDCIRRIAAVRTDAGSFGCHGNHEFYSRCEDYAARRAALHGIKILRQESFALRFGTDTLNLAGVDYQASSVRYLEMAPPLLLPGAYNLLMSHTPAVFPVAAAQQWNLTIAGHTHGGQIGVEILHQQVTPLRLRIPFVRGAYRIGASSLFVSCGLGTIGAPIRIGAPPEVNLIHLAAARPESLPV